MQWYIYTNQKLQHWTNILAKFSLYLSIMWINNITVLILLLGRYNHVSTSYKSYNCIISQLIRYSRTCSSYHDSLDRGLLLTMFLMVRFQSSLRNFYGCHHDLATCVTNEHGIAESHVICVTNVYHLFIVLLEIWFAY